MAQHTSSSGRTSLLGLVGLAVLAAFFGGCAQHSAEAPAFATPWVGVIYPTRPADPNQAARPDVLLADSEFFFPRGDKYIVGPQPVSTISASSEFTYDAQPIGLPGGSGYRYRYVYRENVTFP